MLTNKGKHLDPFHNPDDLTGSTDLLECPYGRRSCQCGRCSICGNGKHTAAHGAIYGESPGGRPWGHAYREIKSADPQALPTWEELNGLAAQRDATIAELRAEVERLRGTLSGMRLNCCQLGDFMYEPVRFCSQQLIQAIDAALSAAPKGPVD